jgi:hypothetical protein
MITLKQYLEEGRDAPLYHGTDNTAQIIRENILKAKTKHFRNALMISDNQWSKTVNGVSLTRNIKVASQFQKWTDHNNYSILELDQRKLTQSYKIIPINFFAGFSKTEPARAQSTPKNEVGSEYEEFVIGDIKNLNKYITRIYIFSKENELYGKPNTFLVTKDDLILGKLRRRK